VQPADYCQTPGVAARNDCRVPNSRLCPSPRVCFTRQIELLRKTLTFLWQAFTGKYLWTQIKVAVNNAQAANQRTSSVKAR
jgi:hypothetical protein